MNGAVAFAAGYATLAELTSIGITRVGMTSARRQPHVGSLALHRVVAAVATAAGVLLAVVIATRHHGIADLAVLAVPVLLGVVMLGRTASDVKDALRDATDDTSAHPRS